MSSTEKHTDSWSPADVQKYLKGELSAREMHQLEKAALDDPFLADALEGLATREPDHRQQDLTALNARLDSRVERRERKALLPAWVKVAAVFILLAGLAFTAFYTLLQPKHKLETPAVAHKHITQPDSSTLSSGLVANAPVASSLPHVAANSPVPSSLPHVAANARRKNPVAKARSERADIASGQPVDADTVAHGITLSMPAVTLDKKALYKDSSASAFAPAYRSNEFLRAPQKQTQPATLISGRVLDLKNRPLAGATLSLNGYKQGTVTDDHGKFSFYVPFPDSTRQLNVAMAGYLPLSFSLNNYNLTENVIRLREDQTSLSEVVITRDGAKRKETFAGVSSEEPEKLDSLWLKAVPVTGRVAYLDYLRAGKKGLGLDSSMIGVERISFAIDRNGTPIDFRIEQSLSPAHDAGVIRLISTGSHWIQPHGKKTRVLVSVSFP